MRVVSLLPSGTEIVAALGHEADLVGRSAECDYPPTVRHRTIVMRPRVQDFERPSREIDTRVRNSRESGESLYVLDIAALEHLQPDLLITQDLCGVCSVTGSEVADACRAAGIDPRILSLSPRDLAGVWESVREVGKALGDTGAAEVLAAKLEGRTRTSPDGTGHPRVAIVEWLDPPIVAGLWAGDMVTAAGGQPLGPASGSSGQGTTWSALQESRPDLLMISPCSFSVDRTRREIDHAGLDSTLAEFRPDRGIWLVDEAFFSRPGPRLADGIDLLRSKLWSIPYTPPMPVRQWFPAER